MQPISEQSSENLQLITESSSLNTQESFFLLIRLLTCFAGIAVLFTGLGFVVISIKKLYQAIMNPETITPVVEQWVEFFGSKGMSMSNVELFIPAEIISTGLVFLVGFLLASISLRLTVTGAKIVAHASIGKATISKLIDQSVKNHLQTQTRSHN